MLQHFSILQTAVGRGLKTWLYITNLQRPVFQVVSYLVATSVKYFIAKLATVLSTKIK